MKRALHLVIGMAMLLLLQPHPAAAAHLDPGAQHAFAMYTGVLEKGLEVPMERLQNLAVLNGNPEGTRQNDQ